MLCGEDATPRDRAYPNTPPYEWGPEVSFPPAPLCGTDTLWGLWPRFRIYPRLQTIPESGS